MIDLFLGGPLGLWTLDQVDKSQVRLVCSADEAIRRRAIALNIQTQHHHDLCHPVADRVGLSFHYPRLFEPEFLACYKVIYNIHPGLLPWGRCYYPVFWSLWANEPAGCTLHVIDSGVDTGPIVAQRAVAKYDWDTGGTLHARVSEAEKGLFLDYWPRIVAGEVLTVTKQSDEIDGSFHYRSDFFTMKNNPPLGEMSGDDLLYLIRCLSHPDYSGLVVTIGGRRYEVSMREL